MTGEWGVPLPDVVLDRRASAPVPPLLTVAVCVRDGAADLQGGFTDDLFGAWGRDLELVALDDGSTDDTSPVLLDLARRLGDAAVLRNPVALGPGIAREQLVRAARGDYLWFADADDAFDLAAVLDLARDARREGLDAVVARAEVMKDGRLAPGLLDAVPPGERDGREWLRLLVRGDVHGYLWNKVLRRELLADADGLPLPRTQEDFCRVVLAAARSSRVLFSDRVVYRYLMRSSSVTRSRHPELGNLAIGRDYLESVARSQLEGDAGLDEALERFTLWYYAAPAVRIPVHVGADAGVRAEGRRRARAAAAGIALRPLWRRDRGEAVLALVLREAPALYTAWVGVVLAVRGSVLASGARRLRDARSRLSPVSVPRRNDAERVPS